MIRVAQLKGNARYNVLVDLNLDTKEFWVSVWAHSLDSIIINPFHSEAIADHKTALQVARVLQRSVANGKLFSFTEFTAPIYHVDQLLEATA